MALLLIPVLLTCNILEDSALLFLTWLLLLLSAKEGVSLHDGPDCDTGQYLSNGNCTPCSVCVEGHGVRYTCEGDKDTVCTVCPKGQYSKQTSGNRFCTSCTDCTSLNRNSVSNCTKERDAVCGRCRKGFFLQVGIDGRTSCAECSQCPPGKDPIRWYECADMPESQQCAPGYSEQSTIEPAVNESKHHLPWDIAFAKLANRTVFLPFATHESTEEDPWYWGVISATSIMFTLLTACVFGCAFRSFCKRLVGRLRSRS